MEALSRCALTPRAKGRVCASWYSTSVSWLRRLRAASRDFSFRSSVFDLWEENGTRQVARGTPPPGVPATSLGLEVSPLGAPFLAPDFTCLGPSPCGPPCGALLQASPLGCVPKVLCPLRDLAVAHFPSLRRRLGDREAPRWEGVVELAGVQGRDGALRDPASQAPFPPSFLFSDKLIFKDRDISKSNDTPKGPKRGRAPLRVTQQTNPCSALHLYTNILQMPDFSECECLCVCPCVSLPR